MGDCVWLISGGVEGQEEMGGKEETNWGQRCCCKV